MPFTGDSSDSSDGECDDVRGNKNSLTPSSLGSTDLTLSSPKHDIALLSSSPRKSTGSSLGLSPSPLVFTNANHPNVTSLNSDTSFAYNCKGRLQEPEWEAGSISTHLIKVRGIWVYVVENINLLLHGVIPITCKLRIFAFRYWDKNSTWLIYTWTS